MCAGPEPSIQKRTGRLLWHQHRHGCKLSINQNMEENSFSSLDLFLYSFLLLTCLFFVCTFNAHWLFIMPVTARMSLSVQSVALLLWPFTRPSFWRSFCFVFDGQFLLVSLSFMSSESYEFGSFQCRVLDLVITALKVGKNVVYLNAYSRYRSREAGRACFPPAVTVGCAFSARSMRDFLWRKHRKLQMCFRPFDTHTPIPSPTWDIPELSLVYFDFDWIIYVSSPI